MSPAKGLSSSGSALLSMSRGFSISVDLGVASALGFQNLSHAECTVVGRVLLGLPVKDKVPLAHC